MISTPKSSEMQTRSIIKKKMQMFEKKMQQIWTFSLTEISAQENHS
jgi:hypothetical protein